MNTTTNSANGVARYLRLYTVLSRALAEGRIAPGEALPSEPSLVREYGVSRTTVRNALARLETEGRIVRRRGSGTYASHGARRTPPGDLSRVIDATRRVTQSPVRRLEFTRTATPDFLLREWPEFGELALRIRRVRRVGGEPVVLETSYVPAQLASGLSVQGLDGRTVLEALTDLGFRPRRWQREFDAVPADPVAAESLGLALGAPALAVSTIVRDSRRRILLCARFIYRPERYEARFSLAQERLSGRDRGAARG